MHYKICMYTLILQKTKCEINASEFLFLYLFIIYTYPYRYKIIILYIIYVFSNLVNCLR